MARKLYVFGIGGTGSRVIKSLVMLLASGCKLKNDFDTLIPIIIDPDTGNGDLNRTKEILKLYQEIRNQVDEPDSFFKQKISTVNELANDSSVVSSDFFQFKLNNVEQSTFGEYIGFNTLDEDYKNSSDDKNFTRLLYSDKNLKSNLNVGFKGNPNMGSIVLNQFTDSEDFKRFGETFSDGDSIFIINSIFGGTGAAGFPLLLNNLRGNLKIPNSTKIKDAKIGAITYLPYFALDKEDEIKFSSFENKAKIAIDYYNRNIIKMDKINSIYFIGNKGSTKYFEYAVGGKEQKNNASFLEMAGALAVFDFCEKVDEPNDKPLVKEFGIEKDTEEIHFDDLNIGNRAELEDPLTRYKLFSEYLRNGLSRALNISRWTKGTIKLMLMKSEKSLLNEHYFNSSEYKTQITVFNDYFLEWLDEMKDNKPAFNPYNNIGKKVFKSIDRENCKCISIKSLRGEKTHTNLIKVFEKSTKNLVKAEELDKRYNLIKEG